MLSTDFTVPKHFHLHLEMTGLLLRHIDLCYISMFSVLPAAAAVSGHAVAKKSLSGLARPGICCWACKNSHGQMPFQSFQAGPAAIVVGCALDAHWMCQWLCTGYSIGLVILPFTISLSYFMVARFPSCLACLYSNISFFRCCAIN